MTFDPLKFYEDGKRRESRWSAVTPFILVGLLLLVMGADGYLGYKSVKPRPKASAPNYTGSGGTKDLSGAPAIIPYTKLKADPAPKSDGASWCKAMVGGGWICGDPDYKPAFHVTRPRKHKRKPVPTFTPDTSGYLTAGPGLIISSSVETIESEMVMRNAFGSEVRFIQWDRDGTAYELKANGYICAGSFEPEQTLTIRCTPKPDVPVDYRYNGGTKLTPPQQQDFELGAGSGKNMFADKAAEYDQLVLDHSQDFYDNVFVPGGSCTDRENYREMQCASGGKCNKRNEKADWHCLYELWGTSAPSEHLQAPIAKPSCVMPADIDVCPVQMLDPKSSDDKKVKP